MASRAILRKRRFVSNYLNVSAHSIQCFQSLGHGLSSQHADSHGSNSAANHSSGDIDRMKKGDTILPINEDLLNFSALGLFRRKCYGDMVSGYVTGGGGSQFGSPTGMRLKLQSVRYASTAAAGQHDVDAKIDRDHDGKVTPEKAAAAAAAMYLKETSGKEGIQELISNLSKAIGFKEIITDYVHQEITRNWILVCWRLYLLIVMKDVFLSLV